MGKHTQRALRKAALGGSIGPVPKSHRITGEFREPSERPHGQPWLRPWYMSPRKAEEAAGTRREDTGPPIVPRVHSIAGMADGGPIAGDELGSDPIELERLRVMNRGTTDPATMAANAETNRAFVLDNTPVVGNVRSAGRALDAGSDLITAKHYGHTAKARRAALTLALEAAGALSPLPWGRTAGRAAAASKDTANVLIPALEGPATTRAREMRLEDVPMDRIWRETQRTPTPSGIISREIRDDNMSIRPDLRPGDVMEMGDAVRHPALFSSFPQLAERPLRITRDVDNIGNPVMRTDPVGDFEINPAARDIRGQLAKLLQYEVNRESGLARPLRHGASALERGIDNARLNVDRLDPVDRRSVDAWLNDLDEVRANYQTRRTLEQQLGHGTNRSDAAAWTAQRNAGNLEAQIAARRANMDPDALKQWPFARPPARGRQPGFSDAYVLPPEDLHGRDLQDFIDRWYTFGSGRGKFARGGRVKRKALAKAARLTLGGVRGKTGGRADKLPVDVPAGAYVIPADVVAALGDGNTEAGMARLDKQFSAARGMAAGGRAEVVPIQISDGEFVVSPAAVAALGGGDEGYGHEVLDEFVTQTRAAYADHLQNLPGPNR